eukprot:3176839-Pyramimonas_sp.AAC.1
MKAIREEVFAHHQKFEVLAEQLASVQATTDVMSDALANLGESDVIKRLQTQAGTTALQLKELAGQ